MYISAVGPGGLAGELADVFLLNASTASVWTRAKCALWVLPRLSHSERSKLAAFATRRDEALCRGAGYISDTLAVASRLFLCDRLETVSYPPGRMIIKQAGGSHLRNNSRLLVRQ